MIRYRLIDISNITAPFLCMSFAVACNDKTGASGPRRSSQLARVATSNSRQLMHPAHLVNTSLLKMTARSGPPNQGSPKAPDHVVCPSPACDWPLPQRRSCVLYVYSVGAPCGSLALRLIDLPGYLRAKSAGPGLPRKTVQASGAHKHSRNFS